jgi:hypothetical protein
MNLLETKKQMSLPLYFKWHLNVALTVVVLTVVAMGVDVQAAAPKTTKEVKIALVGGWFGATKTDNVYVTFDRENNVQVGLFTLKDQFRLFMGGGSIKYEVSGSGMITFSKGATGTAEFQKDGTIKLQMNLQGPNPGENYQISNPVHKVCEFKQGMMPGPSMLK